MYTENASYWQDEDKAQVADALVTTIDSVVNDQQMYYDNLLTYAKMYKDRTSFDWFYDGSSADFDVQKDRATDMMEDDVPVVYNIVRMCVDTLQSKISLHRPSPKIITTKATQDKQESARDMEQFILGVMYENKVYAKAARQLRDAALYGLGYLKVYRSSNRVKVVYVHPSRIVVDNNSMLTSEPNWMGHIEYIERDALLKMFPEHEELIWRSNTARDSESGVRRLIRVYEGYYKKIGDSPGRHVLAISSGALVDEEYDHDNFPYVPLKLQDDIVGSYGIGIGEELMPIQLQLNKITKHIQDNFEILSKPYVLKHRGSNVSDSQLLSNDDFREIEWSGNVPPEFVYPPAVSQQTIEYQNQLFDKGFQIAGISQLSVTSQKQPGLNSGVAIRTHLDVETQRFSIVSKNWEDMFVEVSNRIIELAQDIAADDPEGYKVQYPNKQFLGEINFNDIDLEKDQFQVQVHVASALPLTPAGRIERVSEIAQAVPNMPIEVILDMLDIPDVDKYIELESSPARVVAKAMEHMLAKGKEIEPPEFLDPDLGIAIAIKYHIDAQINDESEKKVDLIANWISTLVERKSLAMEPPQPQQPEQPVQLPENPIEGVPEAKTSEVLPPSLV